jgi:DNA-binding PadR family transcriptional regulator
VVVKIFLKENIIYIEYMSRNTLTNAELAILSLVAEEARHGYQIEEVIEERGMREWTEIGFSSIYHILGALQKRELVGSRLEPAEGRGPPRRVYRVTPAGRKAYREGVVNALSNPQPLFPLIQQGLAGLPSVDPQAAAEALTKYAAALKSRMARVREKSRDKVPFHVTCMFDYSIRMVEAEAQWAGDLARRLHERTTRRKR